MKAETLREEYRRAFERYLEASRRVRQLGVHAPRSAEEVDAAVFELESARAAYVRRRNAFAEELVPALAPIIDRATPESQQFREGHVKTVAQLLWEAGGRRDGTAICDWRRAEAIVGRAAAAQQPAVL